jgi:hypothetical protein
LYVWQDYSRLDWNGLDGQDKAGLVEIKYGIGDYLVQLGVKEMVEMQLLSEDRVSHRKIESIGEKEAHSSS